jgi:hypothetical protein
MTTQPNKIIFVTFQKEGVHRYPAATDPKLATGGWDDVSFLGVDHRHIFHFRVSIEVFHDDRDIEFIQFKRWLERLYGNGELKLDHKSCEMIADDLYHEINAKFPHRWVQIEVSEDGENGAVSTYQAVTNKSNLTGTDYEHHNPDHSFKGTPTVPTVFERVAVTGMTEADKAEILAAISKMLGDNTAVIVDAVHSSQTGQYWPPGFPRNPGQFPGIGDIMVD